MVFVREDIPSNLLTKEKSAEKFYVEFNLRNNKIKHKHFYFVK